MVSLFISIAVPAKREENHHDEKCESNQPAKHAAKEGNENNQREEDDYDNQKGREGHDLLVLLVGFDQRVAVTCSRPR